MAYLAEAFMDPAALEALPAEQQEAYANKPAYATAAFALAVFGGALACLMLLLRKALASPLFYISFLAILVQMYHAFFVIDSVAMFGPGAAVMPGMIVVIAILLIFMSRKAKANGWIS